MQDLALLFAARAELPATLKKRLSLKNCLLLSSSHRQCPASLYIHLTKYLEDIHSKAEALGVHVSLALRARQSCAEM